MACGAVLAGLSFAFLGLVRSIWLFYLVFVFLSLGCAAMSGIVANTMVSNWFVRRRGMALGVANAGISLSGAFLPYLAMLLLGRVSMEGAFLLIGSVLLLLAPVAWFVVKESPEDVGLAPDGINGLDHQGGVEQGKPVLAVPNDPSGGEPLWTLGRLIRVGAFWKVGTAYGLMVMCVGSIMFQLAPRFVEMGFNQKQAMGMLALTALSGAGGKYVWGMLCDHFEPRRVAAALMTLTGLGVLFGLLGGSYFALGFFIICFGFSMGGIMSTHPIIVADLFGRKSFSSVYRYLALFMVLEAAGFVIMGRSFDLTGSYNTAFIGYIATCLVAAWLVVTVKRPVTTQALESGGIAEP
jgi:MFS family permease